MWLKLLIQRMILVSNQNNAVSGKPHPPGDRPGSGSIGSFLLPARRLSSTSTVVCCHRMAGFWFCARSSNAFAEPRRLPKSGENASQNSFLIAASQKFMMRTSYERMPWRTKKRNAPPRPRGRSLDRLRPRFDPRPKSGGRYPEKADAPGGRRWRRRWARFGLMHRKRSSKNAA
jgi:hypothetical protein